MNRLLLVPTADAEEDPYELACESDKPFPVATTVAAPLEAPVENDSEEDIAAAVEVPDEVPTELMAPVP